MGLHAAHQSRLDRRCVPGDVGPDRSFDPAGIWWL